jgi:phytoene dehydrogenase-like protein
MLVLVATTLDSLVAGEPVGNAPQAKSIHEWKTTPIPAPAADAAATPATLATGEPVGNAPQAYSIREWKTSPNAASAADRAATANSIREWKTTPSAASAASPCLVPTASPAAVPAVSVAVAKSPVTISITSTLRQGKLVVMLDDVPIFDEKFQKPVLLISQTTTWDPVQIPAGQHRLSAKVYGTSKTYLSALYDLNVSRTKASALRFVMQGDKLIVDLAS